MRVRALSFHSRYACKHRGRCCTSGWPIAVEDRERADIERAIEAGILAATHGAPGLQPRGTSAGTAPAAGPTLLALNHDECVFHDATANGGCRIHRAMGHAALPLACRQFPRQSVRDPRGVAVTLSHYCPTAGDLLTAPPGPITIVDNAPAFPAAAEYVGLTADAALPPLLHPRLAMDWESWWLFEELSIALIGEAVDPLPRLGLAVEFARDWTVGNGTLSSHIRDSFLHARHAVVSTALLDEERIASRTANAIAAVPDEWREAARSATSLRAGDPPDDAVTRRYLAAHAFANWAAYQGEGLRTWFRSVETAACLLALTADPGRADLVLRHLADPAALVDRWNQAEVPRHAEVPGFSPGRLGTG